MRRLILIWGSNPIVSNLHFWSRVQEAKRRGAKLVVIDPLPQPDGGEVHQHVALLPGTDAALALGDDARHHQRRAATIADYVARYTLGFDALSRARAGVSRRSAPPHLRHRRRRRSSHLAREYAAHEAGGDPRSTTACSATAAAAWRCATIACLPALIGAWRDAAGGVLLTHRRLLRLRPRRARAPGPDPGRPAHHQPRARSATRCSRPSRRSRRSTSTTTIRSRSARTRTRSLAGFARPDLFTVVHDIFLTDTADYADIVLPATTQLEHFDIHKSYGHLYVLAQPAGHRAGRRSPAQHRGVPAARESAWASPSLPSRRPTRTWRARRCDSTDPRMAGIDLRAR